jgi:hypothetical protein
MEKVQNKKNTSKIIHHCHCRFFHVHKAATAPIPKPEEFSQYQRQSEKQLKTQTALNSAKY